MAQIIGLPKLSPTMEEGVLVRWVKKEGDKVSPGDLVAEVETDKANMDFNLEDEGTLLKLLVAEGATVKLGAPVAILGDPGEDIAELVEQARAGQEGENTPAPSPQGKPAQPAAGAKQETAPPAKPVAREDKKAAAPAAKPPAKAAPKAPAPHPDPPPADGGRGT